MATVDDDDVEDDTVTETVEDVVETIIETITETIEDQDQPHENYIFPEEVLPRGNAL